MYALVGMHYAVVKAMCLDMYIPCLWMMRFGSDAGAKYDLDFKSPNKSGQNFKSGEDMIEMYKELCNGISPFLYMFFIVFCCIMFWVMHQTGLITLLLSLLFFFPCSFFLVGMGYLDYPIVSIEDPFDKEDWEHIRNFCGLGICQVCRIYLISCYFGINLFAVSIQINFLFRRHECWSTGFPKLMAYNLQK